MQTLTEKLQKVNNAGTHNSIYRGQNITDLFYDGTLSEQIAAGTFNDIFVGDCIVGKNSNRKYLVADINYRLHTGNTELTTPHILMIPEKSMGTTQMNSSATTAGAYVGSEMYTTNLEEFKTIIKSDFGTNHILSYKNYLANTVTGGYESARAWYDADIELMNEVMVYGSRMYNNQRSGTSAANNSTIDFSQLSIFRLDKSKTVAFNDSGSRQTWWLRDVYSSSAFCIVQSNGYGTYTSASDSCGVRPAFLIY